MKLPQGLSKSLSKELPVLIAGPTASGKSALAMEIVARDGGVIVNADAIQVYDNWRILTARPSAADEAALPHALYGHVAYDHAYSVGEWLRELRPMLSDGPRPVIVGGTGLYFSALTEGLAEIPPIPDAVRAEADTLREAEGHRAMLADLDAATLARIDQANPMRVQRAWEVVKATGRPLAQWQDETPPPFLTIDRAHAMVLNAPKEWLTPRIDQRFDAMLAQGALDEARANLPHWDPALPSAKAIGAPELIAHLRTELSIKAARDAATIATRQFAKRQRTWFKARMKAWQAVSP